MNQGEGAELRRWNHRHESAMGQSAWLSQRNEVEERGLDAKVLVGALMNKVYSLRMLCVG